MTFDAKLILSVDLNLSLFSFLFNTLPYLPCFAYSKASKVGKACGRRKTRDNPKNSEVLKRVDGTEGATGGLLSTYEFSCVRFKSLVLQRSSSFEAFEYAKLEKGGCAGSNQIVTTACRIPAGCNHWSARQRRQLIQGGLWDKSRVPVGSLGTGYSRLDMSLGIETLIGGCIV